MATPSEYKSDKELVSLLENPPKARCAVGKMVDEHPNGEAINAAMRNPRWSANALAGVLRKIQKISAHAISSHVNGECICEKD